jgi:hypothetical protein
MYLAQARLARLTRFILRSCAIRRGQPAGALGLVPSEPQGREGTAAHPRTGSGNAAGRHAGIRLRELDADRSVGGLDTGDCRGGTDDVDHGRPERDASLRRVGERRARWPTSYTSAPASRTETTTPIWGSASATSGSEESVAINPVVNHQTLAAK